MSWGQALKFRDRAAYAAIMHTPTLRYAAVGFALLAFTGYGIGFWVPPYFLRVRGVTESHAGLILGGGAAVAGWLGVTLGGLWSDHWRRTTPSARLYVGVAAAVLPLPVVIWMLTTESTTLAFVLAVTANLGVSLWIGPGASTVQDLIAPRLRATASAAYLLVVTFGLALGLYTIGRLASHPATYARRCCWPCWSTDRRRNAVAGGAPPAADEAKAKQAARHRGRPCPCQARAPMKLFPPHVAVSNRINLIRARHGHKYWIRSTRLPRARSMSFVVA